MSGGFRTLAFAVVILARVSLAWSSGTQLAMRPGEPFPDLEFDGLLAPDDYASLGLPGRDGPFRLSGVSGEVLVLEFFNRYCLTCWREALQFESFGKLLGPAELGGQVRILSVGSGNTAAELRRFRAEQRVAYPMAPDPLFDRYNDLGEPGGTPFTAFLVRREEKWVLGDFHLGFYGDVELLARARVLARRGLSSLTSPPEAPPQDAADFDGERVREFLSRLTGAPVQIAPVALPGGGEVYEAISADGTPLGLYARAATRQPLCDLCHPIRFLFAFDEEGIARGFEPIRVTKFGNEVWSAQDLARFNARLAGRRMEEVAFDPDVDAVTSATMSCALIYDELRRTAARFRAARDAPP